MSRLSVFEYFTLKGEYISIFKNPIIQFLLSLSKKEITFLSILSIIEHYDITYNNYIEVSSMDNKEKLNEKMNIIQTLLDDYYTTPKKHKKDRMNCIKKKIKIIIHISELYTNYFEDLQIYTIIKGSLNLLHSIVYFLNQKYIGFSCEHKIQLLDLNISYLIVSINLKLYDKITKHRWYDENNILYKDFLEYKKKNNDLFLNKKEKLSINDLYSSLFQQPIIQFFLSFHKKKLTIQIIKIILEEYDIQELVNNTNLKTKLNVLLQEYCHLSPKNKKNILEKKLNIIEYVFMNYETYFTDIKLYDTIKYMFYLILSILNYPNKNYIDRSLSYQIHLFDVNIKYLIDCIDNSFYHNLSLYEWFI